MSADIPVQLVWNRPHFTEEETEAQRVEVTWPLTGSPGSEPSSRVTLSDVPPTFAGCSWHLWSAFLMNPWGSAAGLIVSVLGTPALARALKTSLWPGVLDSAPRGHTAGAADILDCHD